MEAAELASSAHDCDALTDLIKVLRDKNGCPWDRKQDPDTIKRYVLEEAYEVAEAVDNGSPAMVCEELGDLIFQVVFLARLYEEKGAFSIEDVIRGIIEKMVRRHPHVFGDKKVRDADEVKANWHKIKLAEKGSADPGSLLDSIPHNLPALMRAHRITERAGRAGFNFPDLSGIFVEIDGAISQLKDLAQKHDPQETSREFGNFLFKIVVLGRMLGMHAEEALDQALQRFIDKFQAIAPHGTHQTP